jgi:hypothetical protein
MSKKREAEIATVRKEIADQEAVLGGLKEKLARLLNQQNPADRTAVSGLEILWKAALKISRQRSSKHQCRVAWHRLPQSERPTIEVAVAALKAWNQCEQWTKDRNAYAKGLHLFIQFRMWEDLPEASDPLAKYRAPKAVAPEPKPEEIASAEDVSEILGTFSRRNRPAADTP